MMETKSSPTLLIPETNYDAWGRTKVYSAPIP